MSNELLLDCLMSVAAGILANVESSDGAGLGDNESGRNPVRGEGVSVGVGKPCSALFRFKFSGVNDRGLRFRFDGRDLDGVGLVTATAGVGVIGVLGGGTFSLIELVGDGRYSSALLDKVEGCSSSSSSSSSSTRVWSWSLEDEDGPRSLNESRLLPNRVLP